MNLNSKIFLASFLSFAILVAITSYVTMQKQSSQTNYFTTRTQAANPFIPTITPRVSRFPHESISMQPSPDGAYKLIMSTSSTISGINEYTFATMDSAGVKRNQVYKTSLQTDTFSLPFNAWSPDNKYFFIQKNTGEALVFTQTGDMLTPTERYFNVKDIFSQTDRQDRYALATGWASPTLLIVNTTTQDGAKGNSYWFEVPSKAIIQLWGDF